MRHHRRKSDVVSPYRIFNLHVRKGLKSIEQQDIAQGKFRLRKVKLQRLRRARRGKRRALSK